MLKRVGACWRKEKNDKEFFSGNIDLGALGEIKVLVFPNDKKEEENHPDLIIHLLTDNQPKPNPE